MRTAGTIRIGTAGLISAAALALGSLNALAAPRSMSDGRTFDPEYYAETDPEAGASAGSEAEALYQDYLDHGETEGRQPFDPSLVDDSWEEVEVPVYNGNVNRLSHISSRSEEDGNTSWVTMDHVIFREDARELLPLLNAYRQSDDTWYWNSSNTKKLYQTNLNKVSYDLELEKRAQLRAAETLYMLSQGIWAGHVRPDQYELTSESLITINQPVHMTAEQALERWKEENEDYAGQGHRRALLARFRRAGFAHAENAYGEVWVQELGSPYSNEPRFVWPEGEPKEYDYETPVTVLIRERDHYVDDGRQHYVYHENGGSND